MYKVSWNEFESLAIDLAKKIIDDNKSYTAVIGVSRGGLLLARLLSSMLELPMGVIAAKHVDGKYHVDNYVSTIYDIEGDVLLVDDVFDDVSKEIIIKLNKNYPKIKSISQACIFYKTNKTKFKPDYYISEVKDMLTIVFPYQEININENLKYSEE
jgi:hypoxanthine phosphoribosyltransferase